jgi:two-component system chemotaxis response regulator CheY
MLKKVVIVDDSESVANAVAMALEVRLGVQTKVALHPRSALMLFETESEICVLVTDLSLPFLDGFQLIGTVRRMPSYQGLPAVMITAEEDAGTHETPDDCRPNVILRKPFSLTEVCSVVESLLL